MGKLKPLQALPSVRAFAKMAQLSPFTASDIYSQLTAQGLLIAQRGKGYFVQGPSPTPALPSLAAVHVDAVWEHRQSAQTEDIVVDAGNGWLPADWQFQLGLPRALRQLAQDRRPYEGYGSALGWEPLRSYLAQKAQRQGLYLSAQQILITQGATQALDILIRGCLKPHDHVIIEEPAYPPTLDLLRTRGVHIHAIPRQPYGPDVDALKKCSATKRIRAFFTNTSLQNPTGSTTQLTVAKAILELADARDFLIIEDEIFADLTQTPTPTLALLDQCRRVFQVGSFSKSLMPSLRCGFVLAPLKWMNSLTQLKTVSALNSSELTERLTLCLLTDPAYRRHLERLKMRLQAAHLAVQQLMEDHGMQWHSKPNGGLFLFGRLPSSQATAQRFRQAIKAGVLLAPGELFRVDGRVSPYWRFNVARAQDTALLNVLKS
jgi:DNA-binding transcriptional MocR family regulator